MEKKERDTPSRFSLTLNLQLLREQLYLFPRTSAGILAVVLLASAVGFAIAPTPASGVRLSALDLVLALVAVIVSLIWMKLIFALAHYRSRAGTKYPGSFLVSVSAITALINFVGFPISFWVSFVSGKLPSIWFALIMPIVSYPFFVTFLWIGIRVANWQNAPWPSWLPKE